MKNNIFVIFTIFLGIVVVALLFTIATLQSENSDLRNVIRNQANQISEAERYYNNVVAPWKQLYVMEDTTHGLLESKSKLFSEYIHKIAELQQ